MRLVSEYSKIKEQIFKIKDISYISEIKKRISHNGMRNSATVYYLEVIVGGQKVEVSETILPKLIQHQEELLRDMEITIDVEVENA